MSVRFVTGDLLAADVAAIGHGVNCDGVMGAGIAPLIKNMYASDMYNEYQRRCSTGELELGGVYVYVPANHYPVLLTSAWAERPVLFNLATQIHPGPCASVDALRLSVHRMIKYAGEMGLRTIGIPRIGAGLGGLEWFNVKQLLSEFDVHATSNNVDLYVYSLEGAPE